jgi:hypothetical protein
MGDHRGDITDLRGGKIWDLRKMIVPVTYFLEKSFQNWTRSSTNILGTVMLYVDYTVPVPKTRRKLWNFCRAPRPGTKMCGDCR